MTESAVGRPARAGDPGSTSRKKAPLGRPKVRSWPAGTTVLQRPKTHSRRRMTGWRVIAIGCGTAVAASAILTAIAPGSAVNLAAARNRRTRSPADPPAVTTLVSTSTVPGTRVPFAWPVHGQAAVAVRGIGVVAQSPREHPVPIASLTKMMTALVILRDHPLAPRARGPLLLVTPTDVADYDNDLAVGDSTMKIALGERLDEHQLLEALLLPSGDDIADLLARWDAGSIGAFVTKMNAEARALGLTETHYADASGVNPASVSTAADQTVVESALMAFSAARFIVRMQQARLPVAGVIPNYNPAIGVDGIIGVKSGWTSEAGACLATAAYRSAAGQSVLVESVTLGQPGGLQAPALIDEALLGYAARVLKPYPLFSSNDTIQFPTGTGTATFSTQSSLTEVIAWPGLVLKGEITSDSRLDELASQPSLIGTVVGRYEVTAPWGVLATTSATFSSLTNDSPTTSTTMTSLPQPT
jgi:serine-type D-Ala-D-Ala carboxypeptidase (penicillin-binding protein 5/6)